MTTRAGRDANPAGGRGEIRRSVGFAAAMLATALLARLAAALGWTAAAEFSSRASMALPGAFFVLTGNAVPKLLTPLAAMRRDPARVQAFRRFAGWTWVLTGIAFSLAWLALPAQRAANATLFIVPAGMLAVAAGWLWMRRQP